MELRPPSKLTHEHNLIKKYTHRDSNELQRHITHNDINSIKHARQAQHQILPRAQLPIGYVKAFIEQRVPTYGAAWSVQGGEGVWEGLHDGANSPLGAKSSADSFPFQH